METLKDLYQPATAGTVHTNDTNSQTSALAARSAISSQRTRGGKHKRTASKMDTLEAQKDGGKPKKERRGPCTYSECRKMGHWERDCWIKYPLKAPPEKILSAGAASKPDPKGKGIGSNKKVNP
jgi:hypothetical protein